MPGPAVGLSQNTYLSSVYNTVLRGNMFLHGYGHQNKWSSSWSGDSEHGLANILMDDDLCVGGEYVSGNCNGYGGHRAANMGFIDNVCTRAGRDVGLRAGASAPSLRT